MTTPCGPAFPLPAHAFQLCTSSSCVGSGPVEIRILTLLRRFASLGRASGSGICTAFCTYARQLSSAFFASTFLNIGAVARGSLCFRFSHPCILMRAFLLRLWPPPCAGFLAVYATWFCKV